MGELEAQEPSGGNLDLVGGIREASVGSTWEASGIWEHLGSIWEASGKHLRGIWDASVGRILGASGIWEASGKYLGSIREGVFPK